LIHYGNFKNIYVGDREERNSERWRGQGLALNFYSQLFRELGDRLYGVILHEPGHYVSLRQLSTSEFIAVDSVKETIGANGV
jgi:hypothetical protein